MESSKRIPINVPEWIGAAAIFAGFLYFVVSSFLSLGVSSRAILPTGDEPHYLVVAHSLAVDSDLSLYNNYQKQHYRIFYSGPLAKRTSPSGDGKRELPAQGVGLSFLLAPFYYLATKISVSLVVPLLRLVMCSITSVVLFHLIRLTVGAGLPFRASIVVVGGAALASPILTYSSLFYPEVPACLLVTVALRQLLELEEHRWRALIWLGLIPGALLWLHPKYLAIAICIMITGIVFFYRTFRIYPGRTNTRFAVLFALISAAGIFSFFWFLHDQYGSWSPNRIYAGWDKEPQGVWDLIMQEGIGRIGTMMRMAAGLWIDQRFGLVTHSPLYLLFFTGVVLLFRSDFTLRFIWIWFAVHFLLLCWGAPLGGFAPPSRHMIVLLPVILVAVAHIFANLAGVRKVLAIGLFVLSWILALLMYQDYRSLFTNVTWRNPDGLSLFWQRLGIESWIPSLTASDPSWMLILLWCAILAALSWFLYPQKKAVDLDE